MSAGGPGAETTDSGDEPEPPEAFEWSDDMLEDQANKLQILIVIYDIYFSANFFRGRMRLDIAF